jgi:hypothetical protein
MTERPIALITGASSGLGAEFARQLAASGHDLILTARREDRLNSLADELRARYGVTVEVLPADLADPTGLRQVEARIAAHEGLGLLVNNAGFGVRGYFAETDIGRHQAMLDVHVVAATRLAHAALPAMIARGQGAIINVSSVAGFVNGAGGPMYSATKAYLNSFSTNLHAEVKRKGVRVQALCPGYTVTEFHDTPEFANFNRTVIPARLWLSAEAVVRESLRALEHGPVIVVPGAIYKLSVFLTRTGLGGVVSAVRRRFRGDRK